MNLVRGKRMTNAYDLDNRFVEKLQEIVLAEGSIESEAAFESVPSGLSFSEEHTPFGPSAPLERFEIEEQALGSLLLKRSFTIPTYLPATPSSVSTGQGLRSPSIQKAFSAGTMGRGENRHLVPTRWSITACDTMIGDNLLSEVKKCPVIDTLAAP